MADFLSVLRRLYLGTYNWTVFVGWASVLYNALRTLNGPGYQHVYPAVETPLLLAQTAAVLEIIHSMIGLVRSPVSATLPQIGSRLYLTWGILWSFPQVRTHWLVSSLVISWSITEIIRYSFFGMKEVFGFAPSWLLWLRYSTFLGLYPTGISSEVGLIYLALPFIKEVHTCTSICLCKGRKLSPRLRKSSMEHSDLLLFHPCFHFCYWVDFLSSFGSRADVFVDIDLPFYPKGSNLESYKFGWIHVKFSLPQIFTLVIVNAIRIIYIGD
ncbi:very-long-chain (3R)-3-hydroxyacyl-CoA dehydratase PASTICCINO 2 isoform X1 [Telopea speciosissima]|uniref:very-long-chain (3R)-3-hydroxyacyl-CoA dehydratase PASTICCINO 2 isoform X1 n=1 Tax=Telopea speciosissima TaxID=54955 RepID=UPI001CC44983|nr:very-long-chain (3R)-3-hydroxyacyl-CoA dehydratase PASTICCINO 2 isoform X1 [Telopea speciosissima]